MSFLSPSKTCVPAFPSPSVASAHCPKTLGMKKEGPLSQERQPTCCLALGSSALGLAEKNLGPSNYQDSSFHLDYFSPISQLAGEPDPRLYFLPGRGCVCVSHTGPPKGLISQQVCLPFLFLIRPNCSRAGPWFSGP